MLRTDEDISFPMAGLRTVLGRKGTLVHAEHRFTKTPPSPSEVRMGAAVIATGARWRRCWAAQKQAPGSVKLLIHGRWREEPVGPVRELAAQGAKDPGGLHRCARKSLTAANSSG